MMKTKNFFLTAALTMGLAMTGAMMSACSNQDNPTVDPIGGNPPGGQTIVLSKLESDYVAQDGDILTGTLDGNTQPYKISIADGATVSLSDATIQRDSKKHSWAGITCLPRPAGRAGRSIRRSGWLRRCARHREAFRRGTQRLPS